MNRNPQPYSHFFQVFLENVFNDIKSNLSGPPEGSTLDAIPATQLWELPIY
ncbi:hypothetical protein C2G38_2187818 [Gigaspora rosea]|uniref:Uncharacterized protein n=1 Tax=Gigaspora rosea TaxID=44941 RepID=A0A397VBA4_9GLOM|nr:hypothetical protein C2G38_2187818 [Gigaspora rosea]